MNLKPLGPPRHSPAFPLPQFARLPTHPSLLSAPALSIMTSGPDFVLQYMVFRRTKTEFYSPIKLLSNVTPDDKMDSVRLLMSEKENLDPNYVILWIVRFYGV